MFYTNRILCHKKGVLLMKYIFVRSNAFVILFFCSNNSFSSPFYLF